MVFAHYFPPYPVSIDNANPSGDYYATQYLTVNGENNKHVRYGGFLRDRPTPRQPIADTQWRQRDLENEVRSAIAAGIDGFSVDIIAKATDTSWWGSTVPTALIKAAAAVDPNFKIMLMPDMNGAFKNMTAAQMAAEMKPYSTMASSFKLSDGRLVISPFLAENKTAGWWSEFITIMKNSYGINVAFVPVFLDAAANRNSLHRSATGCRIGVIETGRKSALGIEPELSDGTCRCRSLLGKDMDATSRLPRCSSKSVDLRRGTEFTESAEHVADCDCVQQ
ncbi:endo-1,3-alpha-glucanase family glycosylhydrolase [Rhodococcus sp. 3Y1]